MEFTASFLLFMFAGLLTITGFSAFLFSVNYMASPGRFASYCFRVLILIKSWIPGPTWWAILIAVVFLVTFFGAIITYFVKSSRAEVRRNPRTATVMMNDFYLRSEFVSRWVLGRRRKQKRRLENCLVDAYWRLGVSCNKISSFFSSYRPEKKIWVAIACLNFA